MRTIIIRRWILQAGAAVTLAFFGCAANQASPTPIQSGRSCGSISVTAQDPPTDPSARGIQQCFQAAYRTCEVGTTMVLEIHGTDVLNKSTFTLTGGSPCGISGVTETTIVPSRHSTISYTCERLSERNGGLLLTGCGRAGDIFIPPPS